jgi:hypothetical protein
LLFKGRMVTSLDSPNRRYCSRHGSLNVTHVNSIEHCCCSRSFIDSCPFPGFIATCRVYIRYVTVSVRALRRQSSSNKIVIHIYRRSFCLVQVVPYSEWTYWSYLLFSRCFLFFDWDTQGHWCTVAMNLLLGCWFICIVSGHHFTYSFTPNQTVHDDDSNDKSLPLCLNSNQK